MRLKPELSLAYTLGRMKPALTRILPFALSLLVTLTGQGFAVSRGVDAAVGQMVLCTGSGPVVVYVDAEGQPTQAPHFCPDFALTVLGAVSMAEAAIPDAPKQPQPRLKRGLGDLITPSVASQSARAPPSLA
ncbi:MULTISPECIES: hypothetical protein [unclassified Ruegeria]|uniref:hypothetical protein n=1 Tax=unclassified Ruegeria TaxID=2625375 RepID=UPI0020C5533B|nr:MULTISPECIES: hypothetical protein [unclassified Ruegeria]